MQIDFSATKTQRTGQLAKFEDRDMVSRIFSVFLLIFASIIANPQSIINFKVHMLHIAEHGLTTHERLPSTTPGVTSPLVHTGYTCRNPGLRVKLAPKLLWLHPRVF
jgi:hypothetical protein